MNKIGFSVEFLETLRSENLESEMVDELFRVRNFDKAQLLSELEELTDPYMDFEIGHPKADALLLALIGDETVARIFARIGRWYD